MSEHIEIHEFHILIPLMVVRNEIGLQELEFSREATPNHLNELKDNPIVEWCCICISNEKRLEYVRGGRKNFLGD